MGNLVHILFIILIIMFLAVIYLYFKYVKYLEVKHPSVWKKLNKPTWIPSTSPKDKLLMETFENKKEYLNLNDTELNSLFNLRKKIGFVCIISLCLYIGVFLVYIFKK